MLPAVGSARVSNIPLTNVAATAQVVLGLVAVGWTNYKITISDVNAAGVLVAQTNRTARRAVSRATADFPQPQRDWFFANKAAIVAGYGGLYVAVSGKEVAAFDANLSRLIKRFYGERGVIDVYFGYAGEQEPAVGMPAYLG